MFSLAFVCRSVGNDVSFAHPQYPSLPPIELPMVCVGGVEDLITTHSRLRYLGLVGALPAFDPQIDSEGYLHIGVVFSSS